MLNEDVFAVRDEIFDDICYVSKSFDEVTVDDPGINVLNLSKRVDDTLDLLSVFDQDGDGHPSCCIPQKEWKEWHTIECNFVDILFDAHVLSNKKQFIVVDVDVLTAQVKTIGAKSYTIVKFNSLHFDPQSVICILLGFLFAIGYFIEFLDNVLFHKVDPLMVMLDKLRIAVVFIDDELSTSVQSTGNKFDLLIRGGRAP